MALTDQCVGYLDTGEKIIADVMPVPVTRERIVEQQEVEVMVGDTAHDVDSTEPFAFTNGDEVYVAIRDNTVIRPGGEIKFNFHYEDGDVETCVVSSDGVVSVCAKSEYASIFHIRDLCPEACMPEGPMVVGVVFDGTLHARSGVVFYSDKTGCVVHSNGPRAEKYEILFPGTYTARPATVVPGRETKDLCCDTIVKVMLKDMPEKISPTCVKSVCDFMAHSTRNERDNFNKAIEDSKRSLEAYNSYGGYDGTPVYKKPRLSTPGPFTSSSNPIPA